MISRMVARLVRHVLVLEAARISTSADVVETQARTRHWRAIAAEADARSVAIAITGAQAAQGQKQSRRADAAHARIWAIASARHGRRRVALPVERERPAAAAAAAARSARIHQSASQRRTLADANGLHREQALSELRAVLAKSAWSGLRLTPGRRPAARASQTRSRPTGGGSPGWSANQGSHEPTPTAFLSVERRATTTPAASHFWISRRTPHIRNPML
jgi:hypothetical protein